MKSGEKRRDREDDSSEEVFATPHHQSMRDITENPAACYSKQSAWPVNDTRLFEINNLDALLVCFELRNVF